MLRKITPFLCAALLFQTEKGLAQSTKICADGRLQSSQRMALATASQQKLMQRYDVNFYKLDIALERTSTYVEGNTLIQARNRTAPLDTFAFELYQSLQIDSVVVNNVKRNFTRQTGMTYVHFPAPLAPNAAIAARIYYKGTPPAAGSAAIGGGMTSAVSPSWGNRATWSLSQPFSAFEWFPVKQILTDKADSSEVWITTSAINKAGSNGLLKQVVTLPSGKKRYEWKSRYPIAYYLISVAVSDYVEYTLNATPAGAPNPVPIVNYIYSNPGTLAQYQSDIDDTAPLLVKFSELFGLYPFHKEKYGHCMAPLSGGMEHQTMTTQGFFEFTLTAHELAHQWFGDNVTCGSWRDIWLNEGFASYSEYLALEYLRPGQQTTWMNNTHNSVMSQPGGSVYIPAADSMNVNRIFNSRLTYDKGAAVLHMLRFEFNNDVLFFNLLKQWQQLYKNGTAKTPDFKALAENLSGKNLTPFFNQWVYGQGYPTFNLTWNQTGKNFLFRASQVASSAPVTSFFETDIEYKLVRSIGDTLVRVRQTQAQQFFNFKVNGTVLSIQVDPNQWLLNKSGTVNFDPNLVTGVKPELAGPQLNLFPNPATEKLQLTGLDPETESYQILDATGRLVAAGKLAALEPQVNVQTLTKGIYVLKLTSPKAVVTRTFRKN